MNKAQANYLLDSFSIAQELAGFAGTLADYCKKFEKEDLKKLELCDKLGANKYQLEEIQ